MALQKYVIRKISALSIIASAAERYGAVCQRNISLKNKAGRLRDILYSLLE